MTKKKILCKTLLLLFFISFLKQKVLAEEFNIAVLDIEKVIKESNSFVKFEKSLEVEKQKAEEHFKQEEASLREKQSELESKTSILSKEALQKEVIEFQEKVANFQESVNKKGMELQGKINEAGMFLNDIIKNIIEENPVYKKYTIILNKAIVIQINTEVKDITLEVLKDLNKKNIDLSKKISNK